ncbi:MAG: restriction endonuclease subunit S [Rickettsiales bacterium]|nr:restriction endonuclease subunit S [Rickettsiales bacterium]
MSGLQNFITSKTPDGWRTLPFWSMFQRVKFTNYPEEELLSVYRDYGVIPKSSRDDNHNKESEDLSNYQLVDKGWLVTNKMKAWQGSIAISRYRGIVSPAYYAYKPLSKENDQFLHYLLRSEPYIALYQRISKGVRVNQWDLEHEALRNIPILIPDEETQKEIADFLDRETARIDKLIEKKEKLNRLLNEKRKNTISSAVLGLDTPFNCYDRKEIKLKFVVDVVSQKLPYGSIDATYIGLEHIKSWTGEIIEENDAQPEGLVSKFKSGDVLFGKLRPNLAKAALPDFDGVCSTEALVLRPKMAKINPSYLRYCLSEQTFIDDVVGSTYGAKMPRASWEFIGSRRLQLPDVNVQAEIARELDAYTKSVDTLINLSEKSIKSLESFKISLITEAVTGQLDIKAWKKKGGADKRLDNIEEAMAS